MATRNLIMVVDRRHARGSSYGLAIHPEHVAKYSYVNMYHHHDGYPEWQAVQIANWLNVNNRQDGSALAAKLVHDMYYDSCYLYADVDNIDDMDYTDFANGKTRFGDVGVDTITRDEIAKYNKVRANAQKIIDILTTD